MCVCPLPRFCPVVFHEERPVPSRTDRRIKSGGRGKKRRGGGRNSSSGARSCTADLKETFRSPRRARPRISPTRTRVYLCRTQIGRRPELRTAVYDTEKPKSVRWSQIRLLIRVPCRYRVISYIFFSIPLHEKRGEARRKSPPPRDLTRSEIGPSTLSLFSLVESLPTSHARPPRESVNKGTSQRTAERGDYFSSIAIFIVLPWVYSHVKWRLRFPDTDRQSTSRVFATFTAVDSSNARERSDKFVDKTTIHIDAGTQAYI